MLFNWMVTGQVVPTNPAAAVRGPTHVVRTGKTPVLDGAEWRTLLDSIPAVTLRDLRDRALIATLTYSFARINAALKMTVEDLRPRGAGWTIRLHEKSGKQHAIVPAEAENRGSARGPGDGSRRFLRIWTTSRSAPKTPSNRPPRSPVRCFNSSPPFRMR